VPLPAGVQDGLLIIYLHGFASSVHSGKATYLGQRLRAQGLEVATPDLNLPDFSTLTVTRMLEQTRALVDAAGGPVTLIGSSLGGYVAVNAAAQWPDRVARMVLLAPALDFSEDGLSGPQGCNLADWQRDGSIDIFHFGYGRMMPIHYGLCEDARRYNALTADVRMPILVFQGRRDTAVSPATVERWARSRPNVEFHGLDDDHQLTASLPYIWDKVAAFV